jgi:ubiquinone/menaquinone biosynthesis C-methylase UbiE
MTSPSPLATPTPWDLVASAYEVEVVPQFEHFAAEALRLAAPRSGSRVADIACGPGTLALLAARAGFSVDAIDFAPEMIARLEQRIRELGVKTVSPRVGDGQALPYPDGAYSAAFSMFGLMFFPDRAKGFAELRRILAPGARAVVSSWQPMERAPVMAAAFAALQAALPSGVGGGGSSQPPPLVTAEACRAEMGQRFVKVEVHPVSTAVEFASTDALWSSMERTFASLAPIRRQLGEESWAPVSRSVRTALAGALGTGPVTLDLNAWLTVGASPA